MILALAFRVLAALARMLRRRRVGLPGMPRCNAQNPVYSWIVCQRIAGHSEEHQTVIRWARDADETPPPTGGEM